MPDAAGLRIRLPVPLVPAGPRKPRWSYEAWAFLELFALSGLVVVQPLLSVLGNSPDFFIFHGIAAGEVLLLVALFALGPPVAVWGIGALSGLLFGRRVRRAAQAASLAVLAVLFLIQLGKHVTSLRGAVLVVLAVLLAGLVVAAYVRWDAAKQLLRFVAVGPLVFVLLFVFASPSAAVVFPGESPGFGGEVRETGPHPPIVMIILDELALLSLLDDDAQIDAERYPNFARLAGDSTWWRNATAVAGWTPYAVPAMLTGRMPDEHVAPHYAVYPENLFTLLGDEYEIRVSESITQLCPPWLCGDRVSESQGGLPVAVSESTRLLSEMVSPNDAPASDPYDDFAEPTVAEQIGEAAAARANAPDFRFAEGLGLSQPVRFHEFVTGLTEPSGTRPRLDFLHLLMPHTPWTYLPDGMRYYNSSPGLPVDGAWWGRLALQRHEAQLAYTDVLLGEVLSTLQAQGRYEDALVVLTADHGVALTPGPADDPWVAGSRGLGPDHLGAEELMWVPLFIKEPGQTQGRVDERNWQHVDLLPTLAEYAGVAVPWEVDGISWASTERAGSAKTFVSNLRDGADIQELDGAPRYARIVADPGAIPPVDEPPLPELVGTAVADHPVVAGPGGAEAENADAFDDVDPESGMVPALVYGTVPADVPLGTPLAIAVNGEVGAVVPVIPDGRDGGARRFAGLVEDTSVFVAGENQLELFLVTGGTFHRVG